MSRTFRRRFTQPPEWITGDWERVTDLGRDWQMVTYTGKRLAKSIALYHSDNYLGYGWNGNAPKHFRKMIDRVKRAKEKAESKRILNTGDYDGYSYGIRKNDAGYLYW